MDSNAAAGSAACVMGLSLIHICVLRRMAVAVARPCADQRDARRKDGGLLVVEGVLGSVMAHLVEVDGVHKPFVDERAQLVALGVSREKRTPLGCAVAVDVRIGDKAQAVGVAPFVGEPLGPCLLYTSRCV